MDSVVKLKVDAPAVCAEPHLPANVDARRALLDETDQITERVEACLKEAELDLGDVLWGAEEIGKAIGRTPKQTYRLLESGLIPAKKISARWVSNRSALRRAFSVDEQGGASDAPST